MGSPTKPGDRRVKLDETAFRKVVRVPLLLSGLAIVAMGR
jgi:hypothetical protein